MTLNHQTADRLQYLDQFPKPRVPTLITRKASYFLLLFFCEQKNHLYQLLRILWPTWFLFRFHFKISK